MKKLTSVILVSMVLGAGGAVWADSDSAGRSVGGKRLDVAPVTLDKYKQECGSCHFAYQPGLLPARSWEKMMATLDDHFGENAELDAQVAKDLTAYLVEHAADKSDYKRSAGINKSIAAGEAPLRITETAYFKRKHNELPKRAVEDNPKVKSFSKCETCHVNADKGSYNEHEVRIPGFGRWED
ncbi:MAG: diheme cytochrome c [Pseudomonadota bacterium]